MTCVPKSDADAPAWPRPAPAAIRQVKRSSPSATASHWRTLKRRGLVDEADEAELLDAKARADLSAYNRNIENYIGTLKVPVGVIGPLLVRGGFAKGDFYLPLATTEAALVASYGRGARLISAAGGCEAALTAEAVQRAPAFGFASVGQAAAFAAWVMDNFARLKAAADATSSHGRLTAIDPMVEGDSVYLLCSFTTGDAAGQNMVTFAASALCAALLEACPIRPAHWFLEANLSGDKKAAAANLARVRGRKVTACIEIEDALIRRVLHTEPARMERLWRMSAMGGAISGAIGLQGHYANGLAALYLATGQDVACVAESAIGVTRMEMRDGGRLFASVTLPGVMVGTVGGGTQLPSQSAALNIVGLKGAGGARALAELCAALCLAGELSISGALCAGEFASAHKRLARART